MSQRIETITLKVRVVTLSRHDNEEVKRINLTMTLALILVYTITLFYYFSLVQEANNPVPFTLFFGFVIFGTAYGSYRIRRGAIEKIMRKSGWDGKRPARIEVCRADGILHE
jgi:hypothetical protein